MQKPSHTLQTQLFCNVLEVFYMAFKFSIPKCYKIQINIICQSITELSFCIQQYTGCPRRNVPDFGRVFLMLLYTDITQNTYVQSRTVTEIMAREKCGRHGCRNTICHPWRHTCPLPLPDQRDMVMQWPWRVRYSTVALTSQFNISAVACVKYLEV